MNNPFNPKDVKMFNYHPQNYEKKKIEGIVSNMNDVSHTKYQKEESPSYRDFYKKDSYSDHLKQRPSYSDYIKKNDQSN